MEGYAPTLLAALLAAAVMAAVMASDSQILALSTMFTEDVFAYYGGTKRYGDAVQVRTGRLFVIILTCVAYLIALRIPQSIFDLSTQYAFAGYAALSPLLVAAIFWRRSTKWGALASTVWTAAAVAAVAMVQTMIPAPVPGTEVPVLAIGGLDIWRARATPSSDFCRIPTALISAVRWCWFNAGFPLAGRKDARHHRFARQIHRA